jgi:hypothetical protein
LERIGNRARASEARQIIEEMRTWQVFSRKISNNPHISFPIALDRLDPVLHDPIAHYMSKSVVLLMGSGVIEYAAHCQR